MKTKLQVQLTVLHKTFSFLEVGTAIILSDFTTPLHTYETTTDSLEATANSASQIILLALTDTRQEISEQGLLSFYLTVANIVNMMYLKIYTENQNPGN